jgi:hypothetical protein
MRPERSQTPLGRSATDTRTAKSSTKQRRRPILFGMTSVVSRKKSAKICGVAFWTLGSFIDQVRHRAALRAPAKAAHTAN